MAEGYLIFASHSKWNKYRHSFGVSHCYDTIASDRVLGILNAAFFGLPITLMFRYFPGKIMEK